MLYALEVEPFAVYSFCASNSMLADCVYIYSKLSQRLSRLLMISVSWLIIHVYLRAIGNMAVRSSCKVYATAVQQTCTLWPSLL
jgi:hypothetical protein